MKRPADQTGFYRKLEEDKQNLLDADIALYIAIILIVLACTLSGCASTTPTIGECINGKVTWSDGTTERCKILKQSGEI